MTRRPLLKFPIGAATGVLGLYAVFTIVAMLNVWTWDWASVRHDTWATRLLLLGGAPLLIGVARTISFHPRVVTKYGAWLSATPWRSGMDLPLGPPWLVWEDLLFIGPLAAVAGFDAEISPLLPLIAYLIGYSLGTVVCVDKEQSKWFLSGQLFIWSLAVLAHDQLWIVLVILIGVTAFSRFALAISLNEFPWDLGDSMREFKRRPRAGLAWPLDRVGPVEPQKPITPLEGWSFAGLTGWLVFVLLHLAATMFPNVAANEFLGDVVAHHLPGFCAVAAFWRMILYCGAYWPPISLRTRFTNGPLIVPGYDRVLIAPLLMVATAFLLPKLLMIYLPPTVVAGLSLTAVLAIGFNKGPTLRNWQLTGHHRFFPTTRREPAVPKPRASGR